VARLYGCVPAASSDVGGFLFDFVGYSRPALVDSFLSLPARGAQESTNQMLWQCHSAATTDAAGGALRLLQRRCTVLAPTMSINRARVMKATKGNTFGAGHVVRAQGSI
jgi:hypothetical protein